MATTANYYEYADGTTLKESADGASLIFFSDHRTLVFDPLTLELIHNFSKRILDIFGGTVLLHDTPNYFLSELNKIPDNPKPLELRSIISN